MARPWWRKKKKKPLKTRIKRHISVLLGATACTCIVVFAACIPLVIHPAVRVLVARVDPIPVTCLITRAEYRTGKDNCSDFVSCREGSTATLYRCHQLYVNVRYQPFVGTRNQSYSNMNDSYLPEDYYFTVNTSSFMEEIDSSVNPGSSLKEETSQVTTGSLLQETYSTTNTGSLLKEHSSIVNAESLLEDDYSTKNSESLLGEDFQPTILEEGHATLNSSDVLLKNKPQWDDKNIKLYVNVNGYGYPPNVNCTIFWKRFGHVGLHFPCYYSRTQRHLVVTQYDYAASVIQLTTSTLGPTGVFALCLGILWYWHCRGDQNNKES